MNNKEIETKDYFNDLNKIKDAIRQNQNKAMVYVNSQMILTYYEIGTIINERKTWGSKYIQNLAKDLKEYGKGYSIQNLKRMSQFAAEFSLYEISSQHVSQIPWGTLMTVIVPKSKSHEEMLYYINETYKNGWSRSMVIIRIADEFTYNEIMQKAVAQFIIDSKCIEKLSQDLKEYGKGYSYDQLKRMSQFASIFSMDEIRAQPVPLILWRVSIKISQQLADRIQYIIILTNCERI